MAILGACGRSATPDAAFPASPRAKAVAWLAGARFEDADPVTDCRPDCREQERGFEHARKARLERPDDCDLVRVQTHASDDFIEGCRAYGQYIEAAERGR
ncbi:MAG TPA: hypothetical protein VHY32_04595 [Caulobacteraceae bacterium]|jgi:hypothetical protein|nr:hypothetical protein [Caulobacteraceae bacterium]